MNKTDIQMILGPQVKHDLKKFILTQGGMIVESNLLQWDDFMGCYVIPEVQDGQQIFNVVTIAKESDNKEDLEFTVYA